MINRVWLFAAGFIAVNILPTTASADAIDGHWCNGVAKRLFIDGPAIVTPGGKRMEGEYGRHDFAYVVPAGEPGTGGTTRMTILSDDEMHVQAAGTPAGSVEVWRRCRAPVS